MKAIADIRYMSVFDVEAIAFLIVVSTLGSPVAEVANEEVSPMMQHDESLLARHTTRWLIEAQGN
ncbi:MAG: hypothetical protein AB8G99_08525 [Planctomycetaceae bacterium]